MHLREADAFRDGLLCEVLLDVEPEDLAVAVVEVLEHAFERRRVLDGGEAGLLLSDFDSARAPWLVVARGVERGGAACLGRDAGVNDDLDANAHVRSLKWRLISPEIVGTAKDVNAVERSTSKRSIAFNSPIAPTCTRSS